MDGDEYKKNCLLSSIVRSSPILFLLIAVLHIYKSVAITYNNMLPLSHDDKYKNQILFKIHGRNHWRTHPQSERKLSSRSVSAAWRSPYIIIIIIIVIVAVVAVVAVLNIILYVYCMHTTCTHSST